MQQAKKLFIPHDAAKEGKAAPMKDAELRSRAAQMLAEMLALTCHERYYELGEQTVFSSFKILLNIGIRRSLGGIRSFDLLDYPTV